MSDDLTRQTLLLRIRDVGDDHAWNEFVEIYTPLIYNYCRGRGLQEADAADVVQETLKSVAKAIQKFEYDAEKGLFRGWLYTVTRSKLNNHFRKAQRQPQGTGRTTVLEIIEQHPAEADEDEKWDTEYRRHIFLWAAGQIEKDFSEKTWQAFWRTAVEDRATDQVAEELSMSTGAVYIARSRVIARLKELVSRLIGDGDPVELVS